MYQVNLLPWRTRLQRQRYRFWLRFFCAQWLITLVILIFIFFWLNYQQGQQQQVLQALTLQHSSLIGQVEQIQQNMAELARQAAEEVRRQRGGAHNRRYLSLLQQLSIVLPDALWLTKFEGNAHAISLHGLAEHYTVVATFEQRLAALPLLQSCRLAEVMQRQDGVLTFILTASWREDG